MNCFTANLEVGFAKWGINYKGYEDESMALRCLLVFVKQMNVNNNIVLS